MPEKRTLQIAEPTLELLDEYIAVDREYDALLGTPPQDFDEDQYLRTALRDAITYVEGRNKELRERKRLTIDMEEAEHRAIEESVNEIVIHLRPYLPEELPETEEIYFRTAVRYCLRRYRALVITYLREASNKENFFEGDYL